MPKLELDFLAAAFPCLYASFAYFSSSLLLVFFLFLNFCISALGGEVWFVCGSRGSNPAIREEHPEVDDRAPKETIYGKCLDPYVKCIL